MAAGNTTLIVGDTGTGKTELLATLAEWGWKNHKKISLFYSIDGGGYGTKMQALIKAGIVRVWKLRTRGEAFETCSRACQGAWPEEFTNPLAGEVAPGAKLLQPIKSTYTMYCGNCDTVVAVRPSRRSLQAVFKCPKCSKQVNVQSGYVEETQDRPKLFEMVGLNLFDGLTSMQDWVMEDMANKTGTGELKGEGSALGGKIVSGDMVFGGSNRSHYGFAQVRAAQWIQDAANIPGLVVGPVFTARQQRATDTSSNLRIYGPAIAGQAKTSDVPAWVANCLGTMIHIDDKRRKEFRLYLTEYREEDNIPHLCKTRAQPGSLPEFLSDGPLDPKTGLPIEGKPFDLFNLGHFMDLMEEATNKTLKATLEAYSDAPGLDYIKSVTASPKEEQKKEVVKEAVKPPAAPKVAPRVVPKAPPVRPQAAKPGIKRPPVRPRPGVTK